MHHDLRPVRRLALVLLLLVSAARFPASDCNAVVSMSQGAQVYYGSANQSVEPSELETMTGEEWMLLLAGGKALKWWTTPSNWNGLVERHRCGPNSEIDRVVFIFDPFGSDMSGLATVEQIVADRYPAAEFVPVLLVGAVGHSGCNVRAATTHAANIAAVPQPDLDIPCSGYADQIGHLTDAGAAAAQSQLGAYFVDG